MSATGDGIRSRAERELRRRMLDQAVAAVDDPALRGRLIDLRDGKITARDYLAPLTEQTAGGKAVLSSLGVFAALSEEERARLAEDAERRIDAIARELDAPGPEADDDAPGPSAVLRDAW